MDNNKTGNDSKNNFLDLSVSEEKYTEQPPSPTLIAWRSFIDRVNHQANLGCFPHQEISKLLKTSGASSTLMTLRQLLQLVPYVYEAYLKDYQRYKDIILLLHILITKKGCSYKPVLEMAVNVLENMLRYRAVLLCSTKSGKSVISEVYAYLKEWVKELIPKILQYQEQLLVKMFKNLYKGHTEEFDNILIIFEVLLVKNVCHSLTDGSLEEFKDFLKEICGEKRFGVFKGFLTFEKDKDRGKQKEGTIIDIEELVLLRTDQESWHIYDLLIHPNENCKKSTNENLPPSSVAIQKIPHSQKLQQWVVDSFQKHKSPTPVNVSSKRINSMKAMQLYRFLCLLQIYGSSPNIEVLDEYLPNEEFIEFFSRFLMGQKLTAEGQQYFYGNQRVKEVLDFVCWYSLKYSKKDKEIIVEEIKVLLKQIL